MKQEYTQNPKYSKHNDYKSEVLNVLVCQIKVWEASAPDWFTIPDNCTVITEVEEIEINETYKELINGAVIKLPKGVVINDTISSKKIDDDIKSGNKTKQDIESKLSQSSRYGELLTIDDMINEKNEHTLMVDGDKGDAGLNKQTTGKQHIATANDFKIGNRIEVWLGYVYQPQGEKDIITEKLQKVKAGMYIDELQLMFTGFITSLSISSPLEIECENMASILKKKSSRKGVYKGSHTVNDFLLSDSDGGKYGLLSDTGIELAVKNKEQPITLRNFEISDNLSVYDMIHSWSQGNLYSMISRDGKTISVGYFTPDTDSQSTDKERIDWSNDKMIEYVQSDWDVVTDNLHIAVVDKEFMVVRAKAQVRDEKANSANTKKDFSVLVGKIDGKFHYDKHDSKVHKQQKKKKGQGSSPEVVSKFDTKKYHIVDYKPYSGINTMEDLIKAAEDFWNSYNSNKVSGEITVFGDLCIAPAQTIGYISPWEPEKNGHYFVESVRTSFGVNGYRQTVKMGCKLSNLKPVKVIV